MTTSPHIPNDLLSDYVEGLLPDHSRAAVEAHLAGCAECSLALDALRDLQVLLRQAGVDAPTMPTAVGERLDAVIAAESRARADETGVASLSAARHRRRTTGRFTRALVAAASVAVLAVGGGVAISMLRAGGTTPVAEPTHSTSTVTPRSSGPTSFELKASSQAPQLSAAGFSDQVGQLVQQGSPSAGPTASGKSFQPPGGQGVSMPPARCIADVLREAGVSASLDAMPAKFDGRQVMLVIAAGKGPSAVRAYAIAGCPGPNPQILHSGTITVR
ncbi:anti-sigma factor family protein [Actinopolymorpha alba]|uniref:anti-sigma factor family protein n=1 Tax=Actinopolymorpha alba TaxID=533267 RepID=UPI000374FD7A|nr:zf-HC2 domain-containing protein [Actinopolymorpha alba]